MWGILLIGFLLSFLWALIALPKVAAFAIQRKWYDVPNKRKVHTEPIVAIGGIGVFTGFWLVLFCLLSFVELNSVGFLLLASSILFLMSLRDDVKSVRPMFRLLGQLLVASICFIGGVRLEGLYGLFGIENVPEVIQYVLTVLTIVTMINAYNLIDGVNGLSGSLGVLACFIFCTSFWNAGHPFWALMAIVSAGAILGFLKYNFGKATMFMGDNGATFLGLLFAVFCIKTLSIGGGGVTALDNLASTWSIVCLPILDLIRVSVSRMANGKSPLSGDRTHIHHLLLDRGKSHTQIALSLTLLQAFLYAFVQLALTTVAPITLMITLAFIYVAYFLLLKISLGLTAIKTMEYKRKELNLIE